MNGDGGFHAEQASSWIYAEQASPRVGEALVFAFGRLDAERRDAGSLAAGSVTDSGAAIGSIIGILSTLWTHDPLIEVKAAF